MRKRMISTEQPRSSDDGETWLPIEHLASVELTSEDPSHPIEEALRPDGEGGWRAGLPGRQLIRFVFDTPQSLHHIRFIFDERELERSQEFVLRWSPDQGQTFHDIVRQHWNFSPLGATQEIEDYHVELSGVTQLEMIILPDQSDNSAYASLMSFRLA